MFQPVIATFNGRHNEAKSKALITLLDYKEQGLGGLTLKELARQSSVSYEYLKSRLGKWYEWKYVTRRATVNVDRPVYSYSIAARGRHFVEDIIPSDVLAQYMIELKEYHNQQIARIKAFLARRATLRALRG